MSLHISGNAFSALGFLTCGWSELHLSATPKPLIWQAGPDPSFWTKLAVLFFVGAAAICAYNALARTKSAAGGSGLVEAS